MNLIDPVLTELIHTVAFLAFITLLLVGFLTTTARVAFYRVMRHALPRLLKRDIAVIGGLAASFGTILLVRALGIGPTLRENWLYAVLTDIPAISAVAVYVYFEVFVIERGKDHERDRTYLEYPEPRLPGSGGDKPRDPDGRVS